LADRRERPWKKLRVIVEVTVPPTCRADEGDLLHEIARHLPSTVKLARPIHKNAYEAVVRSKRFGPFWPMFLRKERGMTPGRRKETDDPFNGL
jgi:hypothetical protein